MKRRHRVLAVAAGAAVLGVCVVVEGVGEIKRGKKVVPVVASEEFFPLRRIIWFFSATDIHSHGPRKSLQRLLSVDCT
ncbi:hypothetical protein G4B88_021185 [Cannabis sativa]|uniref:Uncharacterized protein n=1 Tax=Cannabis sativa TaxID=3483 RepID=A0A7J6HYU0_CANSA|nr:hypothetical protein G4B88_021185 [Cannabis sativa]